MKHRALNTTYGGRRAHFQTRWPASLPLKQHSGTQRTHDQQRGLQLQRSEFRQSLGYTICSGPRPCLQRVGCTSRNSNPDLTSTTVIHKATKMCTTARAEVEVTKLDAIRKLCTDFLLSRSLMSGTRGAEAEEKSIHPRYHPPVWRVTFEQQQQQQRMC